jgi:hypothetical protein
MKTMRYLIFLFFVSIVFHYSLFAQNENSKQKKQQISLEYYIDFVLREYHITGATHQEPIYNYELRDLDKNNYNYSVGINYKYYLKPYVYLKSSLLFRDQASYRSNCEINIDGNKHIYNYTYNKVFLKYFDIPIGIGFSFLNKNLVRPYIQLNINNSIIISEKVDLRDYYYISGTPYFTEFKYTNNSIKYYNLKGSIDLGCEFYIHKKFVLGIDINLRTIPFKQNQNTIIHLLKYSNYGFGINFGYVIK